MATQGGKKVINVLTDNYASEEHLSKHAILTREGSKKFNQSLLRDDRKVIIKGIKVGQIDDTEDPIKNVNYAALVESRSELISSNVLPKDEKSEDGVLVKRNFLPPTSISAESAPDSEGNADVGVRLLLSFMFSKDALYDYTNPGERYSDESSLAELEFTMIHEIGIYAQVFQEVNQWVSGIQYTEGDIVAYPDPTASDHEVKLSLYRRTGWVTQGGSPYEEQSTAWSKITGEGADEFELTGHHLGAKYWIPVMGEDNEVDPPFLLYYIHRPENPLYIEFGHMVTYVIAIELMKGAQLDSFYINQEDAMTLPEIQLAYLATLSAAHRYARDIFRENEVLRGSSSRGAWKELSSYEIGDLVTSVAWVGYDMSYSGWGTEIKLWKCKIPHSNAQLPGQAYDVWEEVDVLTNRKDNELKEIVFR